MGVFDNDISKIGGSIKGIRVYSIKDVKKFIINKKISIALLCVPAGAAPLAANTLVEGGIKGILNFAPVALILPDTSILQFDMASEIGSIIYRMKENV